MVGRVKDLFYVRIRKPGRPIRKAEGLFFSRLRRFFLVFWIICQGVSVFYSFILSESVKRIKGLNKIMADVVFRVLVIAYAGNDTPILAFGHAGRKSI